MFELWTISSTPGISPLCIAARASAACAEETLPCAGASPGSGVAVAGPAMSMVAISPAAADATPRRLSLARGSRVMDVVRGVRNEVTPSSLVSVQR